MLHDLYADCCVKVPNSGAISNMGRVRLGPESAFAADRITSRNAVEFTSSPIPNGMPVSGPSLA
jgi:hypothetical protein